MDFAPIQEHLREQRLDGWLLHDFRGNNPVLARLLGGKRWTTRRVELFIPARGQPQLLIHSIDASQFTGIDLTTEIYKTWQQLHAWLAERCGGRRIAMDFSPGGALPAMSYVDAGTVELLRGLGAEVVSSADLIQVGIATWSDEAQQQHARASREVTRIKDAAFALIRQRLASGAAVHEFEVQQFILAEFAQAGLETDESPVVAVNQHSGDPHYSPSEKVSSPIRAGDWVLIDLWARAPGEENIFSDITWVAYAGRDVPAQHRRVFETVKHARDAALALAQDSWHGLRSSAARGDASHHHGQHPRADAARAPVQGWQLDEAARAPIIAAGFEEFIRHRTGHSLSPGPMVHGLGMNLDNMETRDTRAMLPGIGFTIEPGIYLPEFGVRLEINIFVDPAQGPVVTSCVQDEIACLA